MGRVLAGGILRAGVADKESVRMSDVDGEKIRSAEDSLGIEGLVSNRELVEWADIIIVAVKPEVVASVLENIGPGTGKEKLLISIAAGIRIANIEGSLRRQVPVVRAMPNTPALINEGVTAIAGGSFARKKHMETASGIFSAVGVVVTVEESMMDAVTALSGSGPAYLFLIAEIMREAGGTLNLPSEVAQKLVSQTVLGSAKMLVEEGADPETLRKKVTSPGGTTEAALSFLKKSGFKEILIRAIQEAARRSGELGR